MTKTPKTRHCGICQAVTARYSHTQNAGAFVIKIWTRDPQHGEVTRLNGTVVRCLAHAHL